MFTLNELKDTNLSKSEDFLSVLDKEESSDLVFSLFINHHSSA